MKPPPMTLDEDDVNGFQQTAAGKRAANKKGRGGKKGGMGIKRDESAQFGDGKYDPTRPCDYVRCVPRWSLS
jgi:splicing factor 45